jgi:hypothetical protein
MPQQENRTFTLLLRSLHDSLLLFVLYLNFEIQDVAVICPLSLLFYSGSCINVCFLFFGSCVPVSLDEFMTPNGWVHAGGATKIKKKQKK